MLTSFPSATAFALALGAGSPCADEPCAGTLGLPATGTLTLLIATHVSMCTSDTSSRPHDRPSPAYGTLRYRSRGQMSDDQMIRRRAGAAPDRPVQTLQHLGDLAILLPPRLPGRLIDVAEIETIAAPQPHLVGRAHGHHHEALELRRRHALPAKPFGEVGADRLARPPDLIRQRLLLDRPGSSRLRRWTSKDNRYARLKTSRSSNDRLTRRSVLVCPLSSVICPLNPAASVHGLSPVTSSAQDSCSTSELLRFLSRMAASKPTSWLSWPSHILCHLAMTWGP